MVSRYHGINMLGHAISVATLFRLAVGFFDVLKIDKNLILPTRQLPVISRSFSGRIVVSTKTGGERERAPLSGKRRGGGPQKAIYHFNEAHNLFEILNTAQTVQQEDFVGLAFPCNRLDLA